MNLSIEQVFARAVFLANNHQEYKAYLMFKNLSRIADNNAFVWLWLAKLSPDYSEGEAALLKIAELGPEDYHLSRAQDKFEQKWHWRKFWSGAGLVVGLALLPFLLFAIYNMFILPQLLDKGLTAFYSRPFITNLVSIVILVLFSLLVSAGFFLYCTKKVRQRVTFWNFFNFNFLWVVGGLLLISGYLFIPAFSWFNTGYTYIGKTTAPTTHQVFHLEVETTAWQWNNSTANFKIYKCDSSGLFCQQFKKITVLIPGGSKPVYFPVEKNNYRLQINETKRELYIFRYLLWQ